MGERVTHAPNRGSAFAAALFEEWQRAGVAHVCICPGSRSAPLAIAAAHSGIPRSTHLDERSAGFFALGLAKAARRPVALVCTSGTAAVNFAPAVVEAHYARVPLLVLTADRPPELREWGAGQTIDQHGLFGSHVRWSVEVARPDASPARLRYARALAARASELASGAPAGPVHLNLPFVEPLDPTPVAGDIPAELASDRLAADGRGARPYLTLSRGRTQPGPDEIASLAERLGAARRGVVLCGPLDATPDASEAIAALARRLGWPLLAEATSPLRGAERDVPVVSAAHWLLGEPDFAGSHRPDFVLRFGAAPTSKVVAHWLRDAPPADWVVVDPDALWHDPSHQVSELHPASPEVFSELVLRRLGPGDAATRDWLADFQAADRIAMRAIEARLGADERLLEGRIARELASHLPPGAWLYVSNSMPVRDLDAFAPRLADAPRVLCNRGANGIDGLVSSALGAATEHTGPVILYTGDLALLHDVSGLLAARRLGLDLVVVVVDNDGGGIFSMLPVAGFGDDAAFREHFRTPHGHDLAALCAGIGIAHVRVDSYEHLRAALKDAAAAGGPQVIVVPTDADASVAQRRAVADDVRGALARELPCRR